MANEETTYIYAQKLYRAFCSYFFHQYVRLDYAVSLAYDRRNRRKRIRVYGNCRVIDLCGDHFGTHGIAVGSIAFIDHDLRKFGRKL